MFSNMLTTRSSKSLSNYNLQRYYQLCVYKHVSNYVFKNVDNYHFQNVIKYSFLNMVTIMIFENFHLKGSMADVHIRGFMAGKKL